MPALRFSLRDLFALVTLSGVFCAFGLPYVQQLRDQARLNQCSKNLAFIHIGFTQFATSDPGKRFNSGPYEVAGANLPDQVGWVADLLKLGVVKPRDLLCSTNEVRGLAPLND